jgi:Response regulator containing a CheY-like receiver domain and an HTH DNA-binding domain
MNWLTPILAFVAAAAIFTSVRIGRIDKKSSLNRKLAAACLFVGLYELAAAFMVAAPTASYYAPALIVAATIYTALAPLILSGILDFAGIRGKISLLILLPTIAFTLIQIYEIWTGTWVINGFHATQWGNVNEVTRDSLPSRIRAINSFTNAAVGLGALINALVHSQSRRYRTIAVEIFACALLVNVWGVFATEVIWLSWDRPDPTGLGAGIVLILYAFLIERYQHLSERKPDMTGPLLASLSGTALFVDARGVIVKAPEGAIALLGGKLEGKSLAEAFHGWPGLASAWRETVADHQGKTGIAGAIGAENYLIHILPHKNPFNEFDGALLRIVPEDSLDAMVKNYGLSVREQEVARLACDGYDTKQIAEALFISQATVKNHLHNVYTKTQTSGRADLVRALLSKGND